MYDKRKIIIQTDHDVIMARLQVRALARKVGLRMTEQARISLASSSAARALGLGETSHGQMVIRRLNGGKCIGVQVVCKTVGGINNGLWPKKLGNAKLMADELAVEKLPSGDTQVTMIKWAI